MAKKVNVTEVLKERRKQIESKLLKSTTRRNLHHIVEVVAEGSTAVIRTVRSSEHGIELLAGCYIKIEEFFQFVQDKWSLIAYSYVLHYKLTNQPKPRCLLRYDLHPHTGVYYDHINALQPEPFKDKIHLPTWAEKLEGIEVISNITEKVLPQMEKLLTR